ncbi:MAG TPA: glycosyltransferase [Sulfurimonas autotrophica]|nr:glycosyltransferase [Sulfurimonas autotrophica]
MKISISIPTYNRLENVRQLSKSLRNVNNIKNHHIRIYDDASTEFGKEELIKIFPNAVIKVNKHNRGADINTYQICKNFLMTDDDILLLCDSDLILHPESLDFIENHIKQTDGILSIFNSSAHSKVCDFSDKFILKDSVGAAGTVFTQTIMQELINNISEEQANFWDWSFCAYLREKGKRIFVSKQSYVMHTGIDGENSNIMLFEFSQNYQPGTNFEEEQLNKLNQKFINAYTSILLKEKISILMDKRKRYILRKVVSTLFGKNTLAKLLSWRKRRLQDKKGN